MRVATQTDPWEQLQAGARAFLDLVADPTEMNIAAGNVAEQPIEPLAHLIVGALNEAAVAFAADPDRAREEFAASMTGVLESLRTAARAGARRLRQP